MPVEVLATAYKKFLETTLPLSQSPAKVAEVRERASPMCQAAIKSLGGLLLKRKRPAMTF
jgi:hypothetical protein